MSFRTSREVNSDVILYGTKFNHANENYASTIMVRYFQMAIDIVFKEPNISKKVRFSLKFI